jgi:vesicle coat complex subunit
MGDNNDHTNEKPCWVYIDAEPLTSYKDITTKLQSKEPKTMADALSSILGSIINDENYPPDLMFKVMQSVTIVDDINLKKLLFLFWEVNEIIICR